MGIPQESFRKTDCQIRCVAAYQYFLLDVESWVFLPQMFMIVWGGIQMIFDLVIRGLPDNETNDKLINSTAIKMPF